MYLSEGVRLMTTEHLKTFFDTVSAWWGLDNDEEDDYLRLREIQRNTQQVPLNILELGAGSGGTAVCYAKAGHQVTAVEVSEQRVKNMHQWAYESHVNNLNVIQADIYTVNLSQRYDVICYWNGWTWPHESGHIWEEILPHPSHRF